MAKQILVQSLQAFRKVLSVLTLLLRIAFVPRASAANGPGTCAANSESRQLDFWVGDWTISSAGSSFNATSTVSLSLDNCVITENWDGGKGQRGENIFAYSYGDQGWRGLFVDNEGRAHAFINGKISAGTAEFLGPNRGSNGEEVLNRIRVVRLSADKVEQTWDKSTDKGATWNPVFRLEYSRKKS
ncbi:MAG TPA: hypothetical protein VKB40_10005 [Candidatus Acidoferrales bacterium]|nr:hypothetical protein [Candidatus Acidoferrales bacterium]